MFTGIVSTKKPILSIEPKGENWLVTIEKPTDWQLETGESVLIDGICSTILPTTANRILVEYMPETRKKTRVDQLKKGDNLNLERSLKLEDLMSGHMVMGHIDTTGIVKDIQKEPNHTMMTFTFPESYAKYLIDKGSVAVNGVSLTVVSPTANQFQVWLIPHTLEVTNLSELKVGDKINLEFDIFAKYIEKLMAARS